MKNKAIKKIAALIFSVVMVFALSCNVFASTIQDRLEEQLSGIVDEYKESDNTQQKQSLQEMFDNFVKEYNLDSIDLSTITDTDIGKIVGDIGNNLALDDFLTLAQEAWASGTDMIKDVIGGGSGTSSGANTATTQAATQPTNVIVAGAATVGTTAAVGIANTVAANGTSETVTYNVGDTTAASIIGAGVTTAEVTTGAIAEDSGSGMSMSSLAVLLVLSFSTIAVVVAIVIFFVLKRK